MPSAATAAKVVVAGWVAAAGVLLVANLAGPQPGGTTPLASGGGSPTGSVAGAVTGRVGDAVAVEETFDDLPMDASLPRPWQVSGEGAVEVAPLPTSVDRSVRIASDPGGEPALACRPTEVAGGDAVRVALDFRLGRELAAETTLLELRDGERIVVRVALSVDGRVTAAAGAEDGDGAPAGAAIEAASWRRVEVTVAGGGDVTWAAHDTDGNDAGSGRLRVDAPAAPDTVCVQSPAGAPAGWVAVDDLVISG